MPYLLGVDTGGTYTDAVVYDDVAQVVLSKSKSLTTPRNLADGIGAAAEQALNGAGVTGDQIALASLSTTLATNALVEGHGDAAGLIMIGFREADLTRAGLKDALGTDPVVCIDGGHNGSGGEAVPLDMTALTYAIDDMASRVASFAVAGVFAVRNPAHEKAARDLIAERTGMPVTCSHELSSKLGGPKRALTTLLNGRLIGMIHRLIEGAEARLQDLGVDAPLMVVKGDGALMNAAVARARPIETILSGPAASVIGAAHLTGLTDAVISDIGGTTTDIAVLSNGRPRIDPVGARVGGWTTMVEAVAMRTHGLGGDSEVSLTSTGLRPQILLGPQRAVPISLLAASSDAASAMIHTAMDEQLTRDRAGDLDGLFVAPGARRAGSAELTEREAEILAMVGEHGAAIEALKLGRRSQSALTRLIRAGFLRRVAFTPTDAAHVLGLHSTFDGKAAEKAAQLFARRRGNDGRVLAETEKELCDRVVAALHRRSAELALDAALEEDGFEEPALSLSPLAVAALSGKSGLASINLSLSSPLIGLGASAPTYYPAVAAMLKAECAIPEHADVANAVGAVAGQVEVKAEALILSPDGDRFEVIFGDAPKMATNEDQAFDMAESLAGESALKAAIAAGADDPRITFSRSDRRAVIEGRDVLVEGRIIAHAVGRPRF
ncbi:MAG: hydantoinase/oxoprolinase N-terminal domain-containing protein [Pikeienuella sp.]